IPAPRAIGWERNAIRRPRLSRHSGHSVFRGRKTKRSAGSWRPYYDTGAIRPAPGYACIAMLVHSLARMQHSAPVSKAANWRRAEPKAGGYTFYETVEKFGVAPDDWLRQSGLLSISGPLSNLSAPERDAHALSVQRQHW